jgi:hypothetical protein
MDTTPEKLHYVPLPDLPHLHLRDLPRLRMPDLPRLRTPRLPRLRMPNLSLSAAIRASLRGRQSGRRVVATRMDPIPEKFYYVPLPQLPRLHVPDLPFSAAIGRGRRGWHSGRRVVGSWGSHTPDARVVEKWWASHAPEAVLWMLAFSLAAVVGVVVARL